MATVDVIDDVEGPEPNNAFTVLKQRLELDFSFSPQRVHGKTTIEIQPHSPLLKSIHLRSRQLTIASVRLEGTVSNFAYSNLYDRLHLYPGTDAHQHHFPKRRIQRHEDGEEEELVIDIPRGLNIMGMKPDPNAQDATVNGAGGGFGANGELYPSIKLEIEYVLNNFRDGLHFAGVEEGCSRYPHVYTRNKPIPGMASSLFPCVDDGYTKYPFEIAVRYPRTIDDAFPKARPVTNGATGDVHMNGVSAVDSVVDDSDDDRFGFSEEERALEMAVICSGEMTDDILDPTDAGWRTATFNCAVPVLPQHIGIAIGPFEHVDLSEYRDTSDDERLGSSAIRVHAFSLPERAEEVRNSAMILARALDYFTERFQSYPFEKAYKLAFVEDLDCDVASTASFSLCSSRLLFPEDVWEPLENTTRLLVHAVASQWIGVNVIPERPSDNWIIVGASWFMTELYLRDLFGRNDHRFRQKVIADKVIELDIRRPSLTTLGELIPIDPGELEFMKLKALSILFILHNRLVKQSGKNGVDRCLYRLLFNARNEKLPNGAISTDSFLDICEKVGHQKLETFFNQWVHGSGCPQFECYPVFNKKKQVVQLTIKQMQSDPTLKTEELPLAASEFVREAKEKQHGFRPSNDPQTFVGPMTVRIHEADGTPYEHIVDINAGTVKVEIPYNTKYKRLKRNRLAKEREAARGVDTAGEMEDITFYSLGDLFDSAEDAAAWKITDWSQEDEEKMDTEYYEWMRVDADFEWICRATINDMPSYMYVAQLQKDKDVVAQAESIQYLSQKEGHPIISSILVKTLMDRRYFHAIRTRAADVLASSAKEHLDWVGLHHLEKAFKELFCIPGSPMTRSNDFSDRCAYLIQCAIPKAIAKIKGADGKTPIEAKSFLLDIIRYNDNAANEYRDENYIAVLMSCLAQSLIKVKASRFNGDEAMNWDAEKAEAEFQDKALGEIGRHQRLDEWAPTYQNVFTTAAMECNLALMRNRVIPLQPFEFLQYTRFGNADNVRLKAWQCLLDLGTIKSENVVNFMMNEIASDPSPFYRSELIRLLDVAIGQIATGDIFVPAKDEEPVHGGLIIEQDEGPTAREAGILRQKLDGAGRALKAEMSGNESFKAAISKALSSKTTSIHDVSELFAICSMLYEEKNILKIMFKYPFYWKVENMHNGLLRFFHSDKYRTTPVHKPVAPVAPAVPVAPVAPQKEKQPLKLNLGRKFSMIPSLPPTPAATQTPISTSTSVLPFGSASQSQPAEDPEPFASFMDVVEKHHAPTPKPSPPSQKGALPAPPKPAPPAPSLVPPPRPPKSASPVPKATSAAAVSASPAPSVAKPAPAPKSNKLKINIPRPKAVKAEPGSASISTIPSPAPRATSTPTPAPAPAPVHKPVTLKLKTKAPKVEKEATPALSTAASSPAPVPPPKAAHAPKATPAQKVHVSKAHGSKQKGKKSKKVILRVPSDKLAAILARPSQNGLGGTNGIGTGGGANSKKRKAEDEGTGHGSSKKKKLMVTLKVDFDRLPVRVGPF
ncbi:hypothetical protein P154DRAFT_433281 [Amniculicola lignicola CBS 123094]|uniref:Transcription initiation factor TFIID subunit 2 n=1 Tax=Amniculicola lignicola CBS 123094 TaxID=1392246 RepID=A0A6A5WHB9_9PLEO|nr:hypothetical protein P154DRAFT_433281 [Amniculicola lignicola CBS 123094]